MFRILSFITRPSTTKNPKRKRKVIVVKKAPTNGPPNLSDFQGIGEKNQRGSKVFVKRVKKLREPRKTQINNLDKNKFPNPSFFDEIRKQLVFKSSGYVVLNCPKHFLVIRRNIVCDIKINILIFRQFVVEGSG